MTEKNYEAFQTQLRNFRNFVTAQGWTIVAEKEIDYGYQITASDGITKNPVDFFPSGKLLVQGKPGILQTALQLWKQETSPRPSPKNEQTQLAFTATQIQPSPHPLEATGIARIGIDESGKGDYFGPLVIGAVFVDVQTETQLIALGVHDSKLLSDVRILVIAEEIKRRFYKKH